MVFEWVSTFLVNLVDPILSPLLKLNPVLSIFIITVILATASTLIYKYNTDQKKLKEIKDKQKADQKKLKAIKDPKEKMAYQKKMMSKNMAMSKEMMGQSFKPKVMILSMLPILLLFPWFYANLAFEPILPGQDFSVVLDLDVGLDGVVSTMAPNGLVVLGNTTMIPNADNKVWFNYTAEKFGEHEIEFEVAGVPYYQTVKVDAYKYLNPIQERDSTDQVKKITTVHKKLEVIGSWGWLGSYILFSVILSMVIRKLLKVY
ncbi:DUF106 domain-containing protein [Candidatus Woesearchaeota archaeon]|jgi:uncharacterized membrane protein (DUF106 family)|nr:DUF106 domain-containing protein [Candidatus Woesearchaeota archaeon]MBT6520295.1 DUF106 domain-containing protein [Candidatus Woesearchaeota archaeon]MBT7368247.1 DUF106 domain-containing protein [Candidatus Woesearchaeota archaeon]